MKGLKEKQTLLVAALKDIGIELRKLQKERNALELILKNTDETINLTKAKEIGIRNRLSRMIAKEAELDRRKDKVQQQINQLKQKIEKVSKISRDLKEV